jgi:hypothetical protein
MKPIVSSYYHPLTSSWSRSSDSQEYLFSQHRSITIANNMSNWNLLEPKPVDSPNGKRQDHSGNSPTTATLVALVEEYEKLATLAELSEEDAERMAAILDLAQIDSELNQRLKVVDEQIDSHIEV